MLRKTSKVPSNSVELERVHTSTGKFNKEAIKPLGSSNKDEDPEEKLIENAVFGGEENLLQNLEELQSKDKEIKRKKATSDNRKPVWEDDDDKTGSINIKRMKKSRNKEPEKEGDVPTEQYTKHLQTQHHKVHSIPNWARLPSEHTDQSDEDPDVQDLLQSTGDYITPSKSLSKGIIQIKQCTDGNRDNPVQCKLNSAEFHPTSQVMLVAGMNQTLNLFQVDGKNNPKIQSIFLENYPIYSAHFSANGEEVIMGSKHKGFHYYDMMVGKMISVPPIKGLEEVNMKRFVVSPDGRFLAFLGSYGNIHLLSAKSKEWIYTQKMNGSVGGICFSQDGSTMYSYGDDGDVYIWDMKTRDCIHRFIDDGCTKGMSIAVSHDHNFLACGSYSGVVNIYEPSVCLKSRSPKPLKALLNLTTPCTNLIFNSTSEILAMCSDSAERAVKLVHVPSQTVFSNFPDRLDAKLRIPLCMDFSRNSVFFTVGTNKGLALLYRVKHYSNY
ncbi:U3 small nucleolar RNA-associated protein 18 homolog isoform X3 [Mytilus californianus]|uniref:U3 small nucleolar RNA-associated protein 18 homolog isoform X3 n=1 Tax=Mytilus californianus TaxID=6549 RepID=UPI0022486EFC|nr:U3 small nucleolar RNA-associated protein 18 homolog isoform X3 [Mytilus californianus]